MPLEIVLFLGIFPAIAALAGVALGQWMQTRRDAATHSRTLEQLALADRRALRDAKLERLRRAFVPVIIAVWGMRSATSELFFSQSGDLRGTVDAMLRESSGGINQARAQLMLETDVRDVFDELTRVRRAFETFSREVLTHEGLATAEEMKQAQADVHEGSERVEKLIAEHLRRVELSV